MNAELIKALRYCGNFEDRDGCDEECPYFNDKDCPKRIMIDAADALEAAENRIAELEAQKPKEGEWRWLSSTYDRVPCEMRYWCSVCHHEEITHNDKPWKRYCPNCGAKMKGANDEQIH